MFCKKIECVKKDCMYAELGILFCILVLLCVYISVSIQVKSRVTRNVKKEIFKEFARIIDLLDTAPEYTQVLIGKRLKHVYNTL